MASEPSAPVEPGMNVLRPEDITSSDLPVVLRGYDKQYVDRFLQQVSEAYERTCRELTAHRERLRSLEEELAAAEGDVRSSAKSVADAIQRCATAEDQLAQTLASHEELSAALNLSERERKQAIASLREVSERASDLEKKLKALEAAHRARREAAADVAQPPTVPGEAAELLVAAARAAEDVRNASRRRALITLTRARERAMQLHAEAERERAGIAELRERREREEREADEIIARARAEADRVATAAEAERHRMRELLTGALASLEADGPALSDSLMADLSSDLQAPTRTDAN
jgi:DivIVA domain-containing protein